MLSDGEGGNPDKDQARALFEAVADENSGADQDTRTRAQYCLACMLDADIRTCAQYSLACMLRAGEGGEPDQDQARALFATVAKDTLGVDADIRTRALFYLGEMYELGHGGSKDQMKASACYKEIARRCCEQLPAIFGNP